MRYVEIPTPDMCPFHREVGEIQICQHPDVVLNENYLFLCKSNSDFAASCPLKVLPTAQNTTADDSLPEIASVRKSTQLVRERTNRSDILLRDVTKFLIAQGYVRTTDKGSRQPTQRGVDSGYLQKGEYGQPLITKAGMEFVIRRVKAGDFS